MAARNFDLILLSVHPWVPIVKLQSKVNEMVKNAGSVTPVPPSCLKYQNKDKNSQRPP